MINIILYMDDNRFFGRIQMIDNEGNIIREATCNHHVEYYKLMMDGIEISSRKNNDYCGGEISDPLKNFKAVENFGIDSRMALFTRMLDKMQRIATYINKGELKVKGEGFEDACSDLMNYAALLHALNKDIEKSMDLPEEAKISYPN